MKTLDTTIVAGDAPPMPAPTMLRMLRAIRRRTASTPEHISEEAVT